jgi:hypothetical protein
MATAEIRKAWQLITEGKLDESLKVADSLTGSPTVEAAALQIRGIVAFWETKEEEESY